MGFFLSDSSRMSATSGNWPLLTHATMRSVIVFLKIWYGICVTTICLRPPRSCSTWTLPRTTIVPRPVR